MQYLPHSYRYSLLTVITLCALLVGCGEQSANIDTGSGNSQMIAGTWVLKARVSAGSEEPARKRIMRLILSPEGTFSAQYRGDTSQKWVHAGDGGFSYSPPLLTLFWDNGAKVTLLITEQGKDQIRVHHGRNLAPLKGQEPDEIFVKQKMERGPTRTAS